MRLLATASVLSVLGLFGGRQVSAATCNVETASVQDDLVRIISGSFTNPDDLSLFSGAILVDDRAQLCNSSISDVANSFFFVESQRLTDGFSLTFTVSTDFAAGGKTDGFGFVLAPAVDGEVPTALQAPPGQALGMSGGLDTYLGVGFDICADRETSTDCVKEEVRVEFASNDGAAVVVNTVFNSLINANLVINNGIQTNIKIDYLADLNQVVVFINNVQVLLAELDPHFVSLESFFGDNKFAFIGFSGANSANGPATIEIISMDMIQYFSESRLNNEANIASSVDFGSDVQYELVIVDTCNIPVGAAAIAAKNISLADIVATLSTNNLDEQLTLDPATIVRTTSTVSGVTFDTFTIAFATPNIIADWDLNIVVNGIASQTMPRKGIVQTLEPGAGGLGPLGIGLLSTLIAILVILVIIMVWRLDKYRKQLRKHQEDIDFGHVHEEINEIDKEIAYTMNPMIAPLDELKRKVKANEELIRRLKADKHNQMDPQAEINALMEQNQQLRKQMQAQKQQVEVAGAGNRLSAIFRRNKPNPGGAKRDFDQERAE